jgi:hypothetical protein
LTLTFDHIQVVDEFGGKGNVLNFNVGDGVKFALPNVFWTRLTGKYGTVSSLYLYFSPHLFLILITELFRPFMSEKTGLIFPSQMLLKPLYHV